MYLGIDIGTTTVCAVLIGGSGEVLESHTLPNSFALGGRPHEKLQDAEKITDLCLKLAEDISSRRKPVSIGVSGQMHGILYVDGKGRACSPLIGWQDGRGDLPLGDSTYARRFSELTGRPQATGYGGVTLFYDSQNGLPQEAETVATVGDYVAMRLAGRKTPLMHPTNAASLGIYDPESRLWDRRWLNGAGRLLPPVAEKVIPIGNFRDAAVCTAVGDHQAAVYGAEKGEGSLIVNVGTGSQISMRTKRTETPAGLELRPYFHGEYLLTGCALSGGYSYELLKKFFRSISPEIGYEIMNDWAMQAWEQDVPVCRPLFRGSREDPAARASFENISEENFNAPALTLSVLKGISEELYTLYRRMGTKASTLIGTGNGIRRNPALRRILEESYRLPLAVPAHREEAAFGAALLAAEAIGTPSVKDFIRYI